MLRESVLRPACKARSRDTPPRIDAPPEAPHEHFIPPPILCPMSPTPVACALTDRRVVSPDGRTETRCGGCRIVGIGLQQRQVNSPSSVYPGAEPTGSAAMSLGVGLR